MPSQDKRRKRQPGLVLIRTFPVAKYLAVLLISLNLRRLPRHTWLFPGCTVPRAVFMLWVVLLLLLGWLADRQAARERQHDADEQAQHPSSQVLHLVSFLALAVPGLLLLDTAAIVHLYLSWYHSAASVLVPLSPVPTIIMAAGCVFIIYGRALPSLPFRSLWGIPVSAATASASAWTAYHQKAGIVFSVVGLLCLLIGTFI